MGEIIELICKKCGSKNHSVVIQLVKLEKFFGDYPAMRCECSNCKEAVYVSFPCVNPNLEHEINILVLQELKERFEIGGRRVK